MPTPEQLHAEITSGTPGPIRSLGQDLTDESRTLDEACNDVLDGLTGTRWEDGLARAHFHLRGQEVYVATSLAAWRLFRCGDLLVNVAREYAEVVDEADAQLRAWQALTPEQKNRPATEASWVRALTTIRERWSDRLVRAAQDLTDDEPGSVANDDGDTAGRDSDEDWATDGAARDFAHHLANGTRRGPRIPNSYLNSGEDWVQQGLAYDRNSDSYLMTSYGLDPDRQEGTPYEQVNPKASNLTLIDRGTGQERQSVQLAGPPDHPNTQPQHSGGVTVVGDDVYVVSTEHDGEDDTTPRMYRYSLADIEAAGPGETVQAQARFEVPASSYISHDQGRFYLGAHSDEGSGQLYELTGRDMENLEKGEPPAVEPTLTPPGVNGATVLEDRIVYSQNHGRGEPSQLISVPRGVPYLPLPGLQGFGVESGSLVEESTAAGNDLASMTEAGAQRFSPEGAPYGDGHLADGLWAQTHMTIDPGGARPGGQDIDVEPQSLRSSSRTFAGVADAIGGVRGRVRGTTLAASTMGQVAGAGTMSDAIGTQADRFADDLTTATDGAETTFEGLRWCADGYEITDHASFDALEAITGGVLG